VREQLSCDQKFANFRWWQCDTSTSKSECAEQTFKSLTISDDVLNRLDGVEECEMFIAQKNLNVDASSKCFFGNMIEMNKRGAKRVAGCSA